MTTTSDTAADDQALITAVPARMVEMWAAHDAEAFAELFLEDGTMILPGVYKKGRTEIREFMEAAYASHFKGTTVTGQPIDVKPLAPNAVALLTVGGVLPTGETELTGSNAIRATWILVKRDGEWKLAVYHNCARDRPTP